jgi:Ser/Thr protein kinase RdoA (MazF antagonist)
VTDVAASPGLPDERREQLVERLPEFHALIRELQAGPVPETLVHGDCHPWNVQRDGDRLVIFDWSDACWGHPFFDVATFTQRTDDEAARDAMRHAHLEAWADHADDGILRDALAKAELLTELHLSITWRRLSHVFEADGAYPFVDAGVQRHLELALTAVKGVT